MRILIVDDEKSLLQQLEQILLQERYIVETASNGEMALDKIFESSFDLIILDIMMPKVDGVKVLKTIRNLEKGKGIQPGEGAKVVMTTALGETEYVHQAFHLGCEAYAAKPIDTDKLLSVIRKLGLIE